MKLQFNLLPDVKQQYLKAQRTKRTVISASFAAAAVSLFILLLMVATVYVVNKNKLSDANKNIDKYSQQLKSIPNLDKILTVQNQLNSISSLHQQKHITSRIYQFLPQLTPSTVCMGKLTMDLTANSLVIEGSSDSQKSVNTFIDTLKFTTYKMNGQETSTKAFPSVIESQFGLDSTNSTSLQKCGGKPAVATYQLTVQFDPSLFSNANQISLTVPAGLVTTRSVLDDPSGLFTGAKSNSSSQGGGQ